jgi:hypothetical protein
MIAVYIDPAMSKYYSQIKYTIEYILNTSGFSWKYLETDTELTPNDVILFYSPALPEPDVTNWMIKESSFIYIPFMKEFYIPGHFSGEKLKYSINTFKSLVNLPYMSTTKLTTPPLQLLDQDNHKYCIYEFDLIGNIFFHLSDDNRNHLTNKDKNNNYFLHELGFHEHFDIPYINHYIEGFFYVVNVLVNHKRQFQLVRCAWPGNQPFAALITHDLNRLQKWNFYSIFYGFFEIIIHIIKFRYRVMFRNTWSIIKYLFTNVEDYWCFYDISQIERKHKFKSTWFVGVNKDKSKKNMFDYDVDDPDVIKEMQELLNYGSEVGLLYNTKYKNVEDIQRELDFLNSKIKSSKLGIRHINFFGETESLDKIHQTISVNYDSSRKLQDSTPFYNGLATPYPLYARGEQSDKKDVYELPVTFSDESLRLSKYRYRTQVEAMKTIKDIVNVLKKVKGVFHLQLQNSLFHDIKYMPRLLEYIVDDLKNQKAYVASCAEMVQWMEKRIKYTVTEEEDKIILKFSENIEQITFEVIGSKMISNVFGGNCSCKKNVVQFVNVVKGLDVEIHLIDGDPQHV